MKTSDSVFLIGPMGAGKSTVGRRLAHMLKRRFIDCDKEIERRTGVSIPVIFEVEGEAGFRAREKAVLADLACQASVVLATGGGAVLDADNRWQLLQNGFVVYLSTSVEEQLRRTTRDTNRPLLQTPDPHRRLAELSQIREPLYREIADIVIRTDGRQARRVVQTILERLKGCDAYHKASSTGALSNSCKP
jgi:shikimate kinase